LQFTEGEEILWTHTPRKMKLLSRPGTTRLFQILVLVYVIGSTPYYIYLGFENSDYQGWIFAVVWLQILLFFKVLSILYIGITQCYIVLSTRILVLSSGLFDVHVNSFPLGYRFDYHLFSRNATSGSIRTDKTGPNPTLVLEYVPNLQELQNIIAAQLSRDIGEQAVLTDDEEDETWGELTDNPEASLLEHDESFVL